MLPRHVDFFDPNWSWFSTVWLVSTVAVAVLTAPVGLPSLILSLSFRVAFQVGKKWLLASALKGAIVAYTLVCVKFGGGDGSETQAAASVPASIGTTIPTSVVIHFDDEFLVQNRVHAKIDNQLVEAERLEEFLTTLEEELSKLQVGGCKEAILDLEPYPGPDIERQVKAICGNVGITVSESNSAWGDGHSPDSPETSK